MSERWTTVGGRGPEGRFWSLPFSLLSAEGVFLRKWLNSLYTTVIQTNPSCFVPLAEAFLTISEEVGRWLRRGVAWWEESLLFGGSRSCWPPRWGWWGAGSWVEALERHWGLCLGLGERVCLNRWPTLSAMLHDFFLSDSRVGPWHVRGRCDSQHERVPGICSRCRTSYFQSLYQQPGMCFEGP